MHEVGGWWRRAWLTPLCPAGHLPHKEGDWLDACSPRDPQPLRWAKGLHESISPPVGEMSGRTEAGRPRPPPHIIILCWFSTQP
ncbi:hypothetical protein CTT39_08970 [Agrobacterium rosae]|nr:hypothetical protein CTT39_08970 [Agrobacterium rosae]